MKGDFNRGHPAGARVELTATSRSDDFEWDEDGVLCEQPHEPQGQPWRIAIIDDDEDVHQATVFALRDVVLQQRPLTLLHARSAEEGLHLMLHEPNIAVALIDVVMETPDAGLKLVERLHGQQHILTRLIVRTGQPGVVPERIVSEAYPISHYLPKCGLTTDRLLSVLATSLRAYQQSQTIGAQCAALARANRELTELAQVAAHDLNEPLRAVNSFAALLEAQYGERLDERGQQYLRFLSGGGKRLKRMLDDIVEHASLTRGPRLAETADASVALSVALHNLQIPIEDSSAKIEVGALPRVRINEMTLVRVFQNLIKNAIQYRSRAPLRISVDWRQTGRWATIWVMDNGLGIAAGQQVEIFQRFRRGKHTAEVPGTGLGLALCLDLVRSAGGQMWVKSEPGAGATFYFRLELEANS